MAQGTRMTALYLDIESIPTQRDAVRDYLSTSLKDQLLKDMESVCAPANYKDAEKIAEYCANKKKALQDEFAGKLQEKIEATALDGSFGQVFCIGWAFDDGPVTSCYGMDESVVLTGFARAMSKVPATKLYQTTVVGHNVSAFDLRFLLQRHIINSVRPEPVITRAAQAKPWEQEKVYDTMVQWAGVGNRISLDKLCLALSVPSPKGELDGSKVWQWVQDGRHEEVSEYCA
jgi:hypothetical protein